MSPWLTIFWAVTGYQKYARGREEQMSMTVERKLAKLGKNVRAHAGRADVNDRWKKIGEGSQIYINLIGVLLGSQVINGDPTVPQVLTHDQIRYSGCHLWLTCEADRYSLLYRTYTYHARILHIVLYVILSQSLILNPGTSVNCQINSTVAPIVSAAFYGSTTLG